MPRTHTVVAGDTLGAISLVNYNVFAKYTLIVQANPFLGERKQKGLVASDGSPLIEIGDVLIIPDETDNLTNPNSVKPIPETIVVENENILTIVIEEERFEFFTNFTITKDFQSLDTVSVSSPYFDEEKYREKFQPLSYKEALVYYGSNLMFNSILIDPITSVTENSETISLTLYPKCGVLADCTMPISAYPIEFNDLNLKQIAENMTRPFGIKVEFIGDPGAAFEKVSPEPTKKVLEFIINLAKQRGFYVSNNVQGDLLIWKASESIPVAFAKQGELPFVSCKPSFKPQAYFSSITGMTPATDEKPADLYTWNNPFLKGINRPIVIDIKDIDNADLQSAVEAAAGRMFGDVGKYSLVLNIHKDKNKNLFDKNTTITVEAPKAFIYKEYNFLIKRVVLNRTVENGDMSNFDLVLPGSYTGKLPKDVPWEP